MRINPGVVLSDELCYRPGDQHLNKGGRVVVNPFEEVRSQISEYTAQEIAILQSRLEKRLGPEYISSRAGPGGQKIHYLAAEKCIQLANEVFGFNGWSSQIKEVQVDFVDENPNTGKISLGLSVIVRVSLRDGTFHEDIGYGHIENCKGKAAAFEKAKKEGTTDALKRALRNFGNVLGNCIYDKEYLTKVTKIKVAPTKWDVDDLHRHSTYAPVKKEAPADAPSIIQEKTSSSSLAPGVSAEDEFYLGEFDETDFMESYPDLDAHPDEVALPPEPAVASHNFNGNRSGNDPSSEVGSVNSGPGHQQNRQPQTRPQQMPAPARPQPQNGNYQRVDSSGGPQPGARQQHPPQPQTPKGGFARSNSGAGQRIVQPHNANQGAIPGPGRVLNQPSRQNVSSVPVSHGALQKPSSHEAEPSNQSMPVPEGGLTIGFFSAKAVLPSDGQALDAAAAIPTDRAAVFNPHAESPSIRKTPGIDHTKSIPLGKNLKHIPPSQATVGSGPVTRGNFLNPQLDATRRIGAPGSPSPLGNRGSYKPPTMTGKRPGDGGNGAMRPPLGEVPANGGIGMQHGGEHDIKRQRMNGA